VGRPLAAVRRLSPAARSRAGSCGVERLYEMMTESGLRRPQLVGFVAPARDGHEHQQIVAVLLAQPAGKVVSVQHGKPMSTKATGG
jgi:hypothetical protein